MIEPLLPTTVRGKPHVDEQHISNGILWHLRTGAPAFQFGTILFLEACFRSFCLFRHCAGGAGGKSPCNCGDGDGDGEDSCGSGSGARGDGLSIILPLSGSALSRDVSGLSPKMPRRASTALRPASS
ncbi:transposase [Brucella anthropi]|nr:transposase [Brucella anthropi]KAB2754046.1 transposase [Brucella anthropi]KAB2780861.1 transposase [Brucella anthropi]KAB2782663.1 transposase [Brucella anthropi]HBQ33647.1 hypothetical protein [Brucella anthropi]